MWRHVVAACGGREPLLRRLRPGVAGTVGCGIREPIRCVGAESESPVSVPGLLQPLLGRVAGRPRSHSFRAVFVWGPHPSLKGRSNPERFRKRRFGQGARGLESEPHFASGRWTQGSRAGGGRCGPRKGEKNVVPVPWVSLAAGLRARA